MKNQYIYDTKNSFGIGDYFIGDHQLKAGDIISLCYKTIGKKYYKISFFTREEGCHNDRWETSWLKLIPVETKGDFSILPKDYTKVPAVFEKTATLSQLEKNAKRFARKEKERSSQTD